MILTIDVGNTNITIGLFDNDELIAKFRMTTKIPRTSDEYGIFLGELIRTKGLTFEDISDVIIASVVPDVMYSLTSGIIKYFNIKPMIVGAGVKTGIMVKTSNPMEVGAGRIVDCVAAFEEYGGPVVVVNFGTATTYDVVNEKGEFIAGITAPGIKLCAEALCAQTAKLPKIELAKPKSILTKDTVTSMQAGIVYGAIGQTECIIKNICTELGCDKIKVVSTGDFGKLIEEETSAIDVYNQDLTMRGLYLIYKKNQKDLKNKKKS